MNGIILDITIPGEPCGQPRQRHATVPNPRLYVERERVYRDAIAALVDGGPLSDEAATIYGRSPLPPPKSINRPEDDTHPIHAYRAAIKRVANNAYRGELRKDPLTIRIDAVFSRPKNLIWKTKPMPRVLRGKTPDFDNVAKAVCDALTGIVWEDDRFVHCNGVYRWTAAGAEEAHTRVIVGEVQP